MSAPTPAQAQALAQADALAQTTVPKPVTPAEAIPAEPAKALDPIAEPSILDKARDIAAPYLAKVEPYVEKAQVVAGEYAEKAAVKTEEFISKVEARIEGASTPTSASSTAGAQAGVPTSKSLADDPEILHPNAGIAGTPTASSSSATINTAPTSVGEAGEKAKVLFEQGITAVQSTFDKLTHTIDEKTASPTHPGIITQVTNAVQKGVEKVEGYLNEQTGTTTAATTATVPGDHPVQTTTNTLSHVPVVPVPML